MGQKPKGHERGRSWYPACSNGRPIESTSPSVGAAPGCDSVSTGSLRAETAHRSWTEPRLQHTPDLFHAGEQIGVRQIRGAIRDPAHEPSRWRANPKCPVASAYAEAPATGRSRQRAPSTHRSRAFALRRAHDVAEARRGHQPHGEPVEIPHNPTSPRLPQFANASRRSGGRLPGGGLERNTPTADARARTEPRRSPNKPTRPLAARPCHAARARQGSRRAARPRRQLKRKNPPVPGAFVASG